MIKGMVPISEHKLLINIKKINERSKKRKTQRSSSNEAQCEKSISGIRHIGSG
jgi:hypothetical protein